MRANIPMITTIALSAPSNFSLSFDITDNKSIAAATATNATPIDAIVRAALWAFPPAPLILFIKERAAITNPSDKMIDLIALVARSSSFAFKPAIIRIATDIRVKAAPMAIIVPPHLIAALPARRVIANRGIKSANIPIMLIRPMMIVSGFILATALNAMIRRINAPAAVIAGLTSEAFRFLQTSMSSAIAPIQPARPTRPVMIFPKFILERLFKAIDRTRTAAAIGIIRAIPWSRSLLNLEAICAILINARKRIIIPMTLTTGFLSLSNFFNAIVRTKTAPAMASIPRPAFPRSELPFMLPITLQRTVMAIIMVDTAATAIKTFLESRIAKAAIAAAIIVIPLAILRNASDLSFFAYAVSKSLRPLITLLTDSVNLEIAPAMLASAPTISSTFLKAFDKEFINLISAAPIPIARILPRLILKSFGILSLIQSIIGETLSLNQANLSPSF